MHIDTMFPAPFLRAADLQGQEPQLTIGGLAMEKVAQNEEKPVLQFAEGCKGLVLNKTNARALAAAYGGNTAGWVGRPVVLFVAQTQRPSGEPCEGIRLRVPPAVAAGPPAVVQSPTGAATPQGVPVTPAAGVNPLAGMPVAPPPVAAVAVAPPAAGVDPSSPDGIPF